MKKIFYWSTMAMCAMMFTACTEDLFKKEKKEGVITMTTEYDEKFHGYFGMSIEVFKEGEIVTIDWGDGSVEEFKSIERYYDKDEDDEYEVYYVISNSRDDDNAYVGHKYSKGKPYMVTIKGNIKELNCTWHNLTSLDASKCTALTVLDCSENNLTSLNVSGCTALTQLSCGGNLTSLDVSKCTALTWLGCGGNNLTSLDVSKNTALTGLDCGENNLTSLNVSKNTALTYLDCDGNNLTSLDVSKNTALTRLSCGGNNLTSAALNKIFTDLMPKKQGHICIQNNPGTDTCDKSIAERKRWYVNTTGYCEL